MERDTASLVTGKKGWEGKIGGRREPKKGSKAEMRALWTDRWTDRKKDGAGRTVN